MSDLEQRLADALTDGAQGAPSTSGLAAAARSRARTKRRNRLVGAAAVAALAIAVPTAVVATHGSDRDDPSRVANDPDAAGPDLRDGYHYESWHDKTIEVPDSWGYGSLGDWCANDGAVDTPRIQRPGAVQLDIRCSPRSGYGISFQEIPNSDDFQWPLVHQPGNSWPDDAVVGARGIGGVLVNISLPDADLAHQILDSMRSIGPEGDPNGCRSRYTPAAANPPEGALSICRYDETWALEQSEALVGEDAGDAVRALQAAPEAAECSDTSKGSQPHQVIVLQAAGVSATVDLVDGCPRVTVDGQVRELTPDVLYWALSPGWSGSVPGDVSLPSGLR